MASPLFGWLDAHEAEAVRVLELPGRRTDRKTLHQGGAPGGRHEQRCDQNIPHKFLFTLPVRLGDVYALRLSMT